MKNIRQQHCFARLGWLGSIALLACLGCKDARTETAETEAKDAVPPNTVKATAIMRAPIIDGKLDDEVWANVPWTASFQAFAGIPAPPYPGRAKIAWDFRNLYIAFETKDPDVQAKKRDRDGAMWEDDCLEIFIDAAGRADHYLEIGINAENCIHDYLVIRRDGPGDPGRYPEITLRLQSAVAKGKDGGWSVEAAIPWGSFQGAPRLPPRKGDVWRFNLCQMDRDTNGSSAATLGPLKGSHEPRKFLPLVFDAAPFEADRAAAHAAAKQALAQDDSQRAKELWRLGEHLNDVKVVSSRLGELQKKPNGYLVAPDAGYGRVITLELKEPSPRAALQVHPSDSDFPDNYDSLWVNLPKLDTEKVFLWYRMEPKTAKALVDGLGDGIGLAVEIQEPADGAKWRRIADFYAADTEWALREVAIPRGALVRIEIDRGPATCGWDMTEMAFEAAVAK